MVAVVTKALIGGAVDTLDITIIPEAIGSGIPLFTEPYAGPLEVIKSVPYSIGAYRVVYDTTGKWSIKSRTV